MRSVVPHPSRTIRHRTLIHRKLCRWCVEMSKSNDTALYERQKYTALASKTAKLIASSARCSKRRMYPLEPHVASEAALSVASEKTRKKAKGETNQPVATLSDGRNSDDSENDMVSGMVDTDTIMGTSSAQPLRLLQHSRVVHGKLQVFRFVGDKQPSTDVAIANVFSAHPRHVIQKVVCDTAENAVSAALAGNATTGESPAGTVAVTRSNAPDDQSQHAQGEHIFASSSATSRSSSNSSNSVPVVASFAQTATIPPLPTHQQYRTVFATNDESVHLAGTDVEPPSAALLEYMRELASRKVMNALAKRKQSASTGTAGASCNNQHYKECMQDRLDPTALVAVTVLVEELVRDMMVNWYQKGTPLGFDARNLRTEALAQMNGAPDPRVISVAMLQNRLEVLFGRKLDTHTEDIKLFRKVAILGLKSKSAKPKRSSKKDVDEAAVYAPAGELTQQ